MIQTHKSPEENPAMDSMVSEDGIYEGNAAPYVETVIQEGMSHIAQVSSVMICGNVSLLSDSAIQKAAQTCHVVVVGKEKDSKPPVKNAHYYEIPHTEEEFEQLFDAYDMDTVWYISGYADGQNGMDSELKYLENVVKISQRNAVGKLIVVSSVESLNFYRKYDMVGRLSSRAYASAGAFATAQMEDFVRYYAKNCGLKTIVLRAPYIATENGTDNFLGKLFEKVLQGGEVVFPYCPENKVDFLSDSDLVTLLLNVSEEGADKTATYNVTSGYHYTWQDLETELRLLNAKVTVTYEKNANFMAVQTYSIELKRQYGFIPMDNMLDKLGDAYFAYRWMVMKGTSLKQLFRNLRDKLLTNLAGYIELVLLFALAEFLVEKTQVVVYFKYVDIRLFYVLIMGTTYGTSMGVLAGFLAGVALFFQYQELGINGTMLFYNLENWLPFVVYLMTGSITGYISNVRRQENSFQKQEYEMLREKYLFLNDVYHSAIENKGEYKRQILGYKDSFGVIFQAVQKLDSVLPQEIFMNGIRILEDILQNHTMAIFTIDDWQRFGRLAVSSGEILETLPKSIEIAAFEPVYNTLQKGEVWKNTALLPGMPMYAYGICTGEKVDLMIFAYDAAPEQMGLYYLNLFSILCNLIKLSFIRALAYQRAIEQEKYYPDTLIVIPAYFEELLNAQKHLMDAGLASYCLIRFASRDKQFLSDSLQGLIRNSDILGADDDGNLYLILTQTNWNSVGIVEERLKGAGLQYEIVSGK